MHLVDSEPPVLVGRVDEEAWGTLEEAGTFHGARRVLLTDGVDTFSNYEDGELTTFDGPQELSDLVNATDADAREVLGNNSQLLAHKLRIYKDGGLPPTYRGEEVTPGIFAKERGVVHMDSHGFPEGHGRLRYLAARVIPTEILAGKFLVAKEANLVNDALVFLQLFSRHIGYLQFEPGDIIRTRHGRTMHRSPPRQHADKKVHPDFINDVLVVDDVTIY